MCTLLKQSKNTSEKRSPLSGRTKAGFSQTNPERSAVLTRGEEALREEGLSPGEKGRVIDLVKNGQMGQKEDRPPRRNPQEAPRVLLLAEARKRISHRPTQTDTDICIHG
jgi:hypothetical protein